MGNGEAVPNTINGRVTIAVLKTELNNLIEHVQEWRTDFKEDLNKLRQACKDDAERLEKRLTDIERLVPAIRVIIWVGAALGVSIVGLIWALITGQVTLVF